MLAVNLKPFTTAHFEPIGTQLTFSQLYLSSSPKDHVTTRRMRFRQGVNRWAYSFSQFIQPGWHQTGEIEVHPSKLARQIEKWHAAVGRIGAARGRWDLETITQTPPIPSCQQTRLSQVYNRQDRSYPSFLHTRRDKRWCTHHAPYHTREWIDMLEWGD